MIDPIDLYIALVGMAIMALKVIGVTLIIFGVWGLWPEYVRAWRRIVSHCRYGR